MPTAYLPRKATLAYALTWYITQTTRATMTTRREKIESMLADDPTDTFLRYSLAMEFGKEGNHDRSLALMGELQTETPPFIPAFFMAAQQLVTLNRIDDSRTMLRNGIEHARQQGDSHAAGEMSEMLTSLGSV